ncbi:unnamed protein product [Symbiodinium microadriaticum]|nr:unnamed protein product [Symbiodinium microadriaticum]
MGNAISSPITESEQERINEMIGDFVKQFSTVFPVTYKDALIETIKEGSQPEEEDERQLPDAPTPEDEIKSGMIVKKCAFRGNFKENHFVAWNKADNFKIEYLDAEGGTLKGTINCCGYKCKKDNEGPLAPFGIKLVPSSSSRRTYFLKFNTEAEQVEWAEVFDNACQKAEAPEDEDKVIAKAFKAAYRAVRRHYGYYGHYRLDTTEPEQLAELCSEILYRDLLQGIVDRIPAGVLRNPTEKMLNKMIGQTVNTAVCGAWNSASTACKSAKAGIEEAATSALDPLFQQEVQLKETIAEKLNEKTQPFLEDVGERVCQPVLKVIAAPITKGYMSAMEEFSKYMKTKLAAGEFRGDDVKIAKSIHRAHRELEWFHSGPLADANHICWEMYQADDLKKVAPLFGDGFTSYDLYSETISSIRDLCHRAVHAFGEALKEAPSDGDKKEDPNQDTLLNEVLTKLGHDGKLSVREILATLLGGMLQSTYEGQVISPSMSLVSPIQETIDAIPVVSSLIDLEALTEEVLQRILDDSVGTFVDSSYGQVEGQLDVCIASILADGGALAN